MIGQPHDHSDRFARGELADPERAERAEARDAEGTLRRREFLARTAALAGSAALASTLPAEQLVAEAARRASRRALPSPRNLPIDTFVVLMMENRSFDHFFGWHPRADGRNSGLSYPDLEGNLHPTHRLPPDWQGCGFRDPNHGWEGGRHQYGRGRLDGFYRGNKEGTGSDEFALGYYLKNDLGFIPHVAADYTLYDRWFCSIMASTFPNRHYQMAATCGDTKSNEFAEDPLEGHQWETIFDRALTRGLSIGYYVVDLPAPGLYGLRGMRWVRPALQFYIDAALGRLPNICFVDPPFGDIGALGLGASDHPHSDIRAGQAYMSDIVHAFVESPQYRRGALFINYDEWGGFFDHVRPPFVPDERRSRRLSEDYGLTGFRIPGVAVSPFTRGNRVSHMHVTHESILKLISYRFGLGHLNKRHRYATNIGRSFDFENPVYEVPEFPDAPAILGLPCLIQGGIEGQARVRPKPHDMTKLQTSGLLDRLGYEVPDTTLEQVFRYPDKARRALEAGNAKGRALTR